jgi:hypothetical protein
MSKGLGTLSVYAPGTVESILALNSSVLRRPIESTSKRRSNEESDSVRIVEPNRSNAASIEAWTQLASTDPVVIPVDALELLFEENELDATLTSKTRSAATRLRPANPLLTPIEFIASNPVGIWEGEVKEIDLKDSVFTASLRPIKGSNTDMSGEISFDQLNPDDIPLVKPGGIFYIEQFRRTVKGQVSFVQAVRFRRLPAWSDQSIQKLEQAAMALANSSRPARVAS